MSATCSRSRSGSRERGLAFVHPFDDPGLIAGHGSGGLEILEDPPDVDVVVVASAGVA